MFQLPGPDLVIDGARERLNEKILFLPKVMISHSCDSQRSPSVVASVCASAAPIRSTCVPVLTKRLLPALPPPAIFNHPRYRPFTAHHSRDRLKHQLLGPTRLA